ncbi:MAG: M81 family metallopeptidase [Candidatus Latescibacterota bacterium]|nr:M81 family metallopeptidase [Candidatus Latescibacterota bacterium]
MPHVFVAGLVHETHTVLGERTGLDAFEHTLWLRGEAMLARCDGDASPMGGALEVPTARGWQVYSSRYGTAMPSGTVTDDVLETWWDDVQQDLSAALTEGIDGILLILHGAMTFQGFADGEGEILRRIRRVLTDRLGDQEGVRFPIAADLDLHANFSFDMAEHATLFTCYREKPHTDAREAGIRAAQLLDRVISERLTPQVVAVKPPVLYSPKGTASAADPVLAFESMARRLELDHPELLEVCVLPGFSYADIPCAGVSFCATTVGDVQQARAWLEPLADEALARTTEGNPLDPPIDEVMPKAVRFGRGPIGLVEPSDNIGGGTPGDGTGILAAFLRYEVDNAVVVINDPAVAAACHEVSEGDRLQLSIGAKLDRFHGDPMALEVKLENLTDGRFTLENEKSHLASLVGRHVDMGPSAVVRHQGVRILLTTYKTPPMDLGQLRSQGIVPEDLHMVGIKAAVAHRAAYDPILAKTYYVDTPGLGSSDLRRFSFRNIPRPMAPLDRPGGYSP